MPLHGTVLQSLLLWCFLSSLAKGQSCVPFTGSPATGTKCDSIITFSNVYLPPGQDLEQVDQAAAANTRLFGAFVPAGCRTAALYLLCLSYFPFCSFNSMLGSLQVLPPCRSVCENMVDQCRDTFIQLGIQASLPDCNVVINSTLGVPTPVFPGDSTGKCYSVAEQTAPPYSQADCPYPLNYDPDASSDDSSDLCPPQCPLPIFSEAKWWAGYITTTSFAAVGFLLTFFFCLTWVLHPKKRQYPAVLPLWIGFSSMLVSVAALITLFVGGLERNTCTWDDTPKQMTFDNARENGGQGVVCILQGCLWLFSGLAGSFWWVAMAFNVFEMVVLRIRKEILDRMYYMYHGLAWGVPLTCVIIALATGNIHGQPGNLQCWVTSPWDWGLYYGWVILNQLVGTILVAASIWRVLQLRRRLKGQSIVKPEQIIRLSFFVVGYWAVWAYLISFRGYVENSKSKLEDALDEQVICSLLTGTECELSYTINYGAWYIQAVAQGSHGIIVFMCLGFSKDTFYFWIKLLRNWRHPWPVISGAVSYSSTQPAAAKSLGGTASREMTFTPSSLRESAV